MRLQCTATDSTSPASTGATDCYPSPEHDGSSRRATSSEEFQEALLTEVLVNL